MAGEALVVSAVVDYFNGNSDTHSILAIVASAVDYAAGGGCDWGMVGVVFGAGACSVCGGKREG